MKLKACPSCDSKAKEQGDEYSERIVCGGQCGMATEWHEDVRLMREAWNTRASDEVISELIEALEWILEDGYAMAIMTIGSRDRLLKALAKAKDYIGE